MILPSGQFILIYNLKIKAGTIGNKNKKHTHKNETSQQKQQLKRNLHITTDLKIRW